MKRRHHRVSPLTALGLSAVIAGLSACSSSSGQPTGSNSSSSGIGVQSLLFIKRQATVKNPDGTVHGRRRRRQRPGARLPALRARRQPEPADARERRTAR